MKKRGIEIHTVLNSKGMIKISQNKLIQVLMNVLNNADDAVSDIEKGAIIIETSVIIKDKPYISLAIHDNGVGISPDNIQRIFEPFFTTKKGEGTGLGLSISYSIIKSYNGEIEVLSEQGRGTEFRIFFPEYSE